MRTPEVHLKVWGTELWVTNTPLYCGKILMVKPGYMCSMHRHAKKDETFFVAEGVVLFSLGVGWKVARPGDAIHVPPNTWHRFAAISDNGAEIIEFSTQHFEDDSERIEESRKISDGELLALREEYL